MAIRSAPLQNLIPELVAALMMLTLVGIRITNLTLLGLLFFTSAFLLRVIWNSSILIHGLGHTLLIAILDQNPLFINDINVLEHRTLSSVLKSCCPFSAIFLPFISDTNHPWITVGRTTSHLRVKALGGISFNAIAIGFGLLILPDFLSDFETSISQFLTQSFVGANFLAIISSLSDVIAAFTGEAAYFNCGNFGFLGKRFPEDGDALLPPRVIKIFNRMGRETEVRGEQAGGGLVLARSSGKQVEFVGKKVLNRKRCNLTQSLEAAFAPVRHNAICKGIKPLDTAVVGVWHYRYGTSSPPAILETHWHEWMPAHPANVWSVEQGQWQVDRKNVNHGITHNGDFEGWIIFGRC
jgi:hypothetical protein